MQYFNKLRQNIITSQPTEKQSAMAQCFESLMEGIDRTLLTKNRDRYVTIPHSFKLVLQAFTWFNHCWSFLLTDSLRIYLCFGVMSMTLWRLPALLPAFPMTWWASVGALCYSAIVFSLSMKDLCPCCIRHDAHVLVMPASDSTGFLMRSFIGLWPFPSRIVVQHPCMASCLRFSATSSLRGRIWESVIWFTSFLHNHNALHMPFVAYPLLMWLSIILSDVVLSFDPGAFADHPRSAVIKIHASSHFTLVFHWKSA